jgi:hypothetical protein
MRDEIDKLTERAILYWAVVGAIFFVLFSGATRFFFFKLCAAAAYLRYLLCSGPHRDCDQSVGQS